MVVTYMACPKQGPKIEGDALLRVGILGLLSYTGLDFYTLSSTPTPKHQSSTPPHPLGLGLRLECNLKIAFFISSSEVWQAELSSFAFTLQQLSLLFSTPLFRHTVLRFDPPVEMEPITGM